MSLYPLKGTVQKYAWGGTTFLPRFLEVDNPDDEPWAEYWLGTHHKGEAKVIAQDKEWNLSEYLSHTFPSLYPQGKLPFLLKILDVRKMLSLQCHPNLAQAQEGFIEENRFGLPLTDPKRLFRDSNHKPEAMVALSDFYLLHGYRDMASIVESFSSLDVLGALLNIHCENQKQLTNHILSLDDAVAREIILSLQSTLADAAQNGTLTRDMHHFWVWRAIDQFFNEEKPDKGILLIYLLNLVRLHPGECIFQEANLIHAYLEGQNIEIMASSDNVFRAGLTQKHISIPHLMKYGSFDTKEVLLNKPSDGVFTFPVNDFRFEIIDSNKYLKEGSSCEIILCTQGSARISADDTQVKCAQGDAFLVHPYHRMDVWVDLPGTQLVRSFSDTV